MHPESAHYMSCSMNKSKALPWFESRAKWLMTITCGWRHTLGMGLGWEGCNNTGQRWNNGLDRSQAPVAYCLPTKGTWQLYKVISRLYLWLRAQQSWKDVIKATKNQPFFQKSAIVVWEVIPQMEMSIRLSLGMPAQFGTEVPGSAQYVISKNRCHLLKRFRVKGSKFSAISCAVLGSAPWWELLIFCAGVRNSLGLQQNG